MNELDSLRQEAETLKNAIRVSEHFFFNLQMILLLVFHLLLLDIKWFMCRRCASLNWSWISIIVHFNLQIKCIAVLMAIMTLCIRFHVDFHEFVKASRINEFWCECMCVIALLYIQLSWKIIQKQQIFSLSHVADKRSAYDVWLSCGFQMNRLFACTKIYFAVSFFCTEIHFVQMFFSLFLPKTNFSPANKLFDKKL